MFRFEPAARKGVGLLISLSGGTGAGKTMSALELATGICGDKPFALIDTEAGRALHYADKYKFDHGDLHAPFTPAAYTEAIMAADAAHYGAIVVDSGSHIWAGDGGVLDMQEAELDRMAGQDWKKREACKMAAWIMPKGEHKRFVSKLLQLHAHLIICLRAEEKIDMVRDPETHKLSIVPKVTRTGKSGWVPLCEKHFPFEMTASFMLFDERPGFGVPIKLQEQHRPMFPLDRPIDRRCGEAITRWAAGGSQALPAATGIPAKVEPAVTPADLSKVLEGIAMAETLSELDAVKKYATILPDADKNKAREAFAARQKEIRSQG